VALGINQGDPNVTQRIAPPWAAQACIIEPLADADQYRKGGWLGPRYSEPGIEGLSRARSRSSAATSTPRSTVWSPCCSAALSAR